MSNVVQLFGSPEDFFAGMFGAPQHDAHLLTRRESIWLAGMQEGNKRADAAVRAELARMSEERRRRNSQC